MHSEQQHLAHEISPPVPRDRSRSAHDEPRTSALSAVRPDTTPANIRYRYGFVARYLRPLVERWVDVHGGTHGDAASTLGFPAPALSEYLNRRRLPTEERVEQLRPLGARADDLRRAALADRLQAWLDANDASWSDVDECAAMVRAHEDRLRRLRAVALRVPTSTSHRAPAANDG